MQKFLSQSADRACKSGAERAKNMYMQRVHIPTELPFFLFAYHCCWLGVSPSGIHAGGEEVVTWQCPEIRFHMISNMTRRARQALSHCTREGGKKESLQLLLSERREKERFRVGQLVVPASETELPSVVGAVSYSINQS